MGLETIEAVVNSENARSRKLLEKCGFARSSAFKEKRTYSDGVSDMLVYNWQKTGRGLQVRGIRRMATVTSY